MLRYAPYLLSLALTLLSLSMVAVGDRAWGWALAGFGALLAAAALLTLWSGYEYLRAAWPSLREKGGAGS